MEKHRVSPLTYIALLFWIISISVFLYELYFYAYVVGLGIHDALIMFGRKMQEVLLGFGAFTPVLFLFLYALRPIVLFPASIITITSVFLFGAVGGFFVSYVGELFSSVVAYVVGKYFGQELGITEKITRTRIGNYFQGNAFTSIFALRIVPLFPFDFVNYSAGIFKLPFKHYMTGTAIGILPGLSAYIFLGYSFLHPQYLVFAAVVFAILIAVSHYTKKKISKRHTESLSHKA